MATLSRRCRKLLCIPFPTHTQDPPLSTSSTRVVHLVNLPSYVIVTQSPQFTLDFICDVGHSIGLEKCISVSPYNYTTKQSS